MAIHIGNITASDFYVGDKHVSEIYLGATKVWDAAPAVPVYQIVDPSWWPATGSSNGIDFSSGGDGSVTADGTASADAFFVASTRPTIIAGHQYYIKGGALADGHCTNSYDSSGWGSAGKNAPTIATALTSKTLGGAGLRVYVKRPTHLDNAKIYPQIFDLTAMFGAGNEPTVAEFDTMFPEIYYPYNPVP